MAEGNVMVDIDAMTHKALGEVFSKVMEKHGVRILSVTARWEGLGGGMDRPPVWTLRGLRIETESDGGVPA